MSYEAEFTSRVDRGCPSGQIFDTATEVLAKADSEREARRLQLHDAIRRETAAQDQYNRDVLGLNNEGDAIGGEPARGMKHYTEAYRTLLAQLRSLAHQVRADMDLLDAWEELVGLIDPPRDPAQQAQAGEL